MHSQIYLKAGTALAFSIALASTSGQAQAQDSETTAQRPGGIAEIVVTARKTDENLQTTPVAVTAVTDIALEKSQIGDISQLQNIAPGLVVTSAVAQPGSAALFIRGQGQNDGLIAVDQSVGAYLDGVYVSRSSGGLFNFVDVERVEVLRGPQGTLFGRNTTGGSVNIVTKQPTNDFEGMAKVRYGNYNAWEATGMINVPIIEDQVALRAVYQHSQHDGYGRNTSFNQELGGDKTDFARGTLLIEPGDLGLKITIQGDFTNRRTSGEIVGVARHTPTGTQAILVATCNGNVAFFPPPLNGLAALQPLCPVQLSPTADFSDYSVAVQGKDNFYNVALSTPGIYGNAKIFGVSTTIDMELTDTLSFKSITAYRDIKTASLSDNDGSPLVMTGGLLPTDGNRINQDQISQEIQFSGQAFNDSLEYIVGGFYFVENGLDRSRSAAVYPVSPLLSLVDASVKNESFAGYGQATYHITDTIRFTGGLRYTKDKREIVRRNRSENLLDGGAQTCSINAEALDVSGFTLPNGNICSATNKASFDYWSYTASLDWQAMDGVFLYAKTSRAYRSGGFNTRAVTGGPVVVFDPEQVTDYELGGKFDFLDRRVRLNLAAFYTDYSNVQRNIPIVVPGSTTLTSGVQNAAAATIKGVEVELVVNPLDGLTLSGSFNYLDPKFDSFNVPVTNGLGANVLADASATPFTYTPKVSYLLSADYEVPTGFGGVNFHLDWAYRGKNFAGGPIVYPGVTGPAGYPASFGFTNPDTARISGYGILNGRISVNLDNPDLELSVYARNITQKKYFTRLLALEDTALGFTSYTPGDPRTYGVSATIKF